MTFKEDSDFKKITFEKEREKFLSDLSRMKDILLGMTDDELQFQFHVKSVHGESLHLTLVQPPPRELKTGEGVQIHFGMPEGQFLLRTHIGDVKNDSIELPLGRELFRLQRRNNFRVVVPESSKISLRLTAYQSTPVRCELPVLNISAGGIRVNWPKKDLPDPKEGESLNGVLILPQSQSIEVSGIMKSLIETKSGELYIGVELQNLSVQEEQTLLFVCMQLMREFTPR